MQKYIAEYLRLSIEDGDVCAENEKEESDSISHQRSIIKQYKLEHELSELPSMEFVDDGYSGTNFNRPEVTHLLEIIKQGNISCVIVKDISRFGRNYLEVGDYLEQVFPFLGVRFISINDNYDSNDYVGTTGGIEIAFKSMLYDMYSKDLSVKMRSSLDVRRKHGDYISPCPPFGYDFPKETKRKLVIDPIASKYVYKIFELARLGYTTGMIARKLNDEGIPTPALYKNMSLEKRHYKILDKTGYWNTTMIRGIIKNKVYVGMVVNKKRQVVEVGGKHFRNVPEEEQICVPDMHEPIVTGEMFRDANKIIKKRQKGVVPKRKRKRFDSILMGKLFCSECGRNLIRITCTTIPYYKCAKVDFDKKCECPRMKLGEPEIEDVVKKCIQKEAEKICDWDKEFHAENIYENVHQEIESLEREKDKIKLHKQFLYEKFKTGYLDQEQYLGKLKTIRNQESKNEELIESKTKARSEMKEKHKVLKETKDFRYITKEIVDALIEKIIVYGENRIEIHWRFQFMGK